MKSVSRGSKIAFAIGALIGFAFTRTPYMEDGNLLVTNVCGLFFGTVSLALWLAFKKIMTFMAK